jgi:hypothetical protein
MPDPWIGEEQTKVIEPAAVTLLLPRRFIRV